MFLDIVIELVKGIGRFFLNPLLYVAIIFSILIGYRRVKEERKSFNIRIFWGWSETILMFKEGWLLGLIISVISVAIGLVVPIQFIVLSAAVGVLCLITFYYHLASAAYPLGIAFIIMWYTYISDHSWHFFNWDIMSTSMHVGMLVSIPSIIGLLLIAEGYLIAKNASKIASPKILKTERGLPSAIYLAKRLWILPVFFVLPGGTIQEYIPYWPQVTLGSESFSFILVPLVVGFQQRSRKLLPVHFYPQLGKTVQILGVIVLIEAIIANFFPIMGIAAVSVAVVGRALVSIIYSLSERHGGYAVMPQDSGVMVAGVLPDSPAEAMGIQVGECIRKVNGIPVKTEEELYEALQVNAAHCRLEVLDQDGEVRLRQHVIYRHDHFRIGLLVVR
ncbi:PDZ domain-containing protein [Rummeliibacillus sp. POC4]|uniref:PDZ domain-containing protein n=1 Tax=Rummeliibacillus sp. POC4 TaxID=2305899 RepID=UPI000E66D389|nr:PDZ domain-containing protein [Rummeliibacillus sp. POC4]RIJ63774.1 PDZ domain-containing protein [Rummeliibacillus sp. POC4]